jgi:hypothetical protein
MVAHTLRVNVGALNAEGMTLARRTVTRTTRRTLNRSAVLCPVDTGNLRATGVMNVWDQGLTVRGRVEYTANYAAAVHNGRRALTIRAKGNGRLRFVVDGQVVFAREVHQPARAGRPFLATALAEVARGEGYTVTVG